ncbi:hypothetical protein HY988_07370 [Candidatus Micrarchaeota archaeon]|nr:hypothetical protein [Candidatus Micrarchaeota archaeon]
MKTKKDNQTKSKKLRSEYLKAFYSVFFKLKKIKNVKEAAIIKMQILSLEADLKKKDECIHQSLSEVILALTRGADEKLREFSKDKESFVYYLGDEEEKAG